MRRLSRRASAFAAITFVTIAFVALAIDAAPPAFAGDRPPYDVRERRLFRFEFDNDTLLGSDDAFTAGWGVQFHSRLHDAWSPAFARWIGRFPGLGDDGRGGRIARAAWGIEQLMVTPTDISVATPQPDDAPWAGILTGSASFAAYDDRRLGALQLLVGCMGPCSGAREVHEFIHNTLDIGYASEGWDNQLAQQWLYNANYEYRYKVFADHHEEGASDRFGQDLSFGGQVGVGNFARFIQAQAEYRFGWDLPRGFTSTPDPAGIGIMLDPTWFDPQGPPPKEERWRSWFSIVARAAHTGYLAPAEGGPTVNGGEHPALGNEPGEWQALLGYHLGRGPLAFHLTYYRYFDQGDIGIKGSTDWVNLSFEHRF